MITLNDVVINNKTFKDVLKASYHGTNLVSDSRKIGFVRTAIETWDEIDDLKKGRTYNNFIILNNVFDSYQLIRFFLSNMDESHYRTIFRLAERCRIVQEYYVNIDGKTVYSSDYISEVAND